MVGLKGGKEREKCHILTSKNDYLMALTGWLLPQETTALIS